MAARVPRDARDRTPPRVPGLPLIGNAWAAARDPCRFFARCHAELGPVFRVTYPGRAIVMMAGLEANAFLAQEGSRVFSAARTYHRVSRELDTTTYPNAHDGAAHHDLRQVLAPSLSAMAVEPFLPRLFEMITAHARAWPPGSIASLDAAVSTLVSDVVGVCTTGQPVGRRLSRDVNLWATLMGVVAVGGAMPEFTLYLPPVIAARTRFARFMRQALAEHRAQPPGLHRDPDMLDSLLAAAARRPEYADPAALLALAMVPMKNAGIYLYRLVSFVLYELLRRPKLLETVTGEVDVAFARGAPGLEDLRHTPTLHAAVLESLRLYPMAIALPRVVGQPFEFGGFRFEPGHTVYIAGPATHFDPALFPEPLAFDPDRYSAARSEHRRPHAYAPFGLGAHACLARGYSQTLAVSVVAGLLRTVRMRLHPEGFELRVRAVPVPIPEARFRFLTVERRVPPPAAPAATVREGLSTALWQITPEQREAVFADLRHQTFAAGETIFRQGDAPDRFYVVQRGEVDVVLDAVGAVPRVLARLGPGEPFGEIGLLQGVPRTATVRASTRTTVLALGRASFNALAVEADVTRREMVQLMERRALVSSIARALPELSPEVLRRLAGTCQARTFEAGAAIVRQGEEAGHFYVLLRGRVEVALCPPAGTEFVVARLDAVDCFGEVGLLQRRPRTATVRAAGGPVTVLEVPRERFEDLLAGSAATADDLARIAGERLLALALAEPG
jgi:CRP-like cAMP-binding protein/cytochrome P450